MLKYLMPFLFFGLLTTSCSDEESTADRFAGTYPGTLVELECTLPQNELSNEAGTATITKISDTELSVDIDIPNGDNFLFSATVNSDSMLIVPQFTQNLEPLDGTIIFLGSDLRIFLVSNCNIFGTEAAKFIFDEN